MPEARPAPPVWRVLELADASLASPALSGFEACRQRWRSRLAGSGDGKGKGNGTGQPQPRLHYVLIAPPAAQSEQTTEFHRLAFDDGRVLFTLCVGNTKSMLREQAFVADEVLVSHSPQQLATDWDRWTAKALAQLCRPGTTLTLQANLSPSSQPQPLSSHEELDATHSWVQLMLQAGFKASAPDPTRQPGEASAIWQGHFASRWPSRSTRQRADASLPRPLSQARPPGHCAVVGGGLAGASVAAALASRGWRVTVLDAATAPCAGASGVPVGLLCPHVSRDDSPRSRLSRAGVRLALQALRRLPPAQLREGQDWAESGTLERWLDEALAPPDTHAGQVVPLAGHPALWHPQAAWVKTPALVQAWLATPGVTWQGGNAVAALHHDGGSWHALDATGGQLAQADIVVIAAAGASPALAQNAAPAHSLLKPLQAVHGQVSFGTQDGLADTLLPPYPLNGHGHLVAQVPQGGGKAWYTGSTYEMDQPGGTSAAGAVGSPDQIAQAHAANAARLQELLQGLPDSARALAGKFEGGQVQHWRGTRFTVSDRLPVCGPLPGPVANGAGVGVDDASPSLWACYGFGSRGLSWSVLCAELVAAQICAEPWPVPLGLARRLASTRRAASEPVSGPV